MVRDLFGPDGLTENAISALWLAPGIPLELEATVLNSEGGDLEPGKNILAGHDARWPAFLGRASYYINIDGLQQLTLGTSYLYGYNDLDQKHDTLLSGFDVIYTYKPNTRQSIAVMAEFFHLDRERGFDPAIGTGIANDHANGGYVGVNFQPITQLYFGGRYDISGYTDQIAGNYGWAASGYVSWYTTEFLRFRLGYEHQERSVTANPDPSLRGKFDTLFFQVTFVFGSHPAEPFWVNR
jgi:hypothetical protein